MVNLYFEDNNLIIIKVQGELTGHDLTRYSYMARVSQEKPSILWDVSEGSMSKLNSEEVRSAANKMRLYTELPDAGKIAFVANTNNDFGMLRMYESYLNCKDSLIDYGVFREIKSATSWLSGSAQAVPA